MTPSLLFVDGNNLSARARHQPQLADLCRADGVPTGVIYGFLKGLSWIMSRLSVSPSDTTIFWDGGRSAKRLEIYPKYKANRNKIKTAEDAEKEASYRFQTLAVQDILSNRPFRQVRVGGVEADDLISVFTHMFKPTKRIVVFSGDQDLWQLYSTNVVVYDPKRGPITAGDIEAKCGGDLTDYVLWKALVGDASDGIRGVEKIGAKRAETICKYLFIPDTGRVAQPVLRTKPGVQDGSWKGQKNGKWVDEVFRFGNRGIVYRNIRLMRLPKTFNESLLSLEQAEDALKQWSVPGKDDTRKFLNSLTHYDIDSVNVGNW